MIFVSYGRSIAQLRDAPLAFSEGRADGGKLHLDKGRGVCYNGAINQIARFIRKPMDGDSSGAQDANCNTFVC